MPTITATVGGSTANSFLSESRAEELIDELVGGAVYVDSSDDDKKARAVITASWLLSSLPWDGVVSDEAQALAFPRTGLTDPGGYVVDTATIPLRIEKATAALALRLFNSATIHLESASAASGLSRLKAEGVELEWRDAIEYKSLPADVRALIPKDWLLDSEPTAYTFALSGGL